MHDVIIVGSGAAGTAAALEFVERGIKPLVLDVGYTKPDQQPEADGNLYSYRMQKDSFELMIGHRFQGLSNIMSDKSVPVKLTSPNMAYVTKDADQLSPIDEDDFSTIQSFSRGGLANAWGAGLYRCTDQDLDGFPFRASELLPFFDKLTQEIGISGTDDDLTPYFGSTQFLQPPIQLSHNIKKLYRNYERKKKYYKDELYIGHSRTGVLTQPKNGRPVVDYNNLEFWQELPSLYSPRMTLDKLIKSNKVIYRHNVLVDSWSENADGVRVTGTDIRSNEKVSFEAKKFLLAAGAINTAKLVMKARQDYVTELPLLENPAVQFPFVLPTSIGRCLDRNAFGLVQLNLVWKSESYNALLQGSIMEITSPMRAELFGSFPYSAYANLVLIRYLLPAIIVMQLFLPASNRDPSHLSLQKNGRLRIRGHSYEVDVGKLKRLIKHLRRMGAWTHPSLVVRVPTGHAVHYAGSLPMKHEPKSYECNAFGKLHDTQNIFIGDAASFPYLPAKNISFTMMANAMRIAAHMSRGLDS